MKTLVGRVTDQTPEYLEYGDYRGWVEIDDATGEWQRNLTDTERAELTLGDPISSQEYEELRPMMITYTVGEAARELKIDQWQLLAFDQTLSQDSRITQDELEAIRQAWEKASTENDD